MATERGALQASRPFLLTPGAQSLVLPNEIVPACTRLYLGSAPTNNEQSLRLLKITHVLSLLDRPHEIPADPTVAHKLVRIADCQSAYMDGALMEALPFTAALEQPAGRLHVHSEAGVSRSTAVVIAALMANVAGLADGVSTASGSRLSYEDALALVRAQRPGVRPNEGFEACLRRAASSSWMRAWQESGLVCAEIMIARNHTMRCRTF